MENFKVASLTRRTRRTSRLTYRQRQQRKAEWRAFWVELVLACSVAAAAAGPFMALAFK